MPTLIPQQQAADNHICLIGGSQATSPFTTLSQLTGSPLGENLFLYSFFNSTHSVSLGRAVNFCKVDVGFTSQLLSFCLCLIMVVNIFYKFFLGSYGKLSNFVASDINFEFIISFDITINMFLYIFIYEEI